MDSPTLGRDTAPESPPGTPTGASVAVRVSDEPVAAYDPRTGEALSDLAAEPTDLLAEIALAFKNEERRLAELRKLVEDELTSRFGQRKQLLTDEFELRIGGLRRKWDPPELEGVLAELHEEGTVSAPEVAAVLHSELTVDGHAARKLLGRLRGSALDRVNACFRWTPPKRPTLEITRATPLIQNPSNEEK